MKTESKRSVYYTRKPATPNRLKKRPPKRQRIGSVIVSKADSRAYESVQGNQVSQTTLHKTRASADVNLKIQ